MVLEKGGNGWAAKGVKFAHKGSEHTVRADCEVILSAGTVQSPQLLELSGIGNPEILKAAEIEVKIENPNVGENLREHMCRTQRSPDRFMATSS
jgi:choline dehydrogenase-like flavoprotein